MPSALPSCSHDQSQVFPLSADVTSPKLVTRMISCGRSAGVRMFSESGKAPFAYAVAGAADKTSATTSAGTLCPTLSPLRGAREKSLGGARGKGLAPFG